MEFVDYAPPAHMDPSQSFEAATTHAYTLGEAIEAGFDPGSYEWREVPEGTWDGHLDFKAWSTRKRSGFLLCYFTDIRTGKRFRLSAGKPWVGDALKYTPKDRAIDFSRPGVDDQVFRLRVRRGVKGRVAWVGAIAKD